MKKIILTLIFMSITASGFSAEWFTPILNFQSEYILSRETSDHIVFSEGTLPENQINFNIIVGGVIFNTLFFEVDIKTSNGFLDWNPMGGMFSPYQSDYGFRGGIQKYGIQLGYEHWCFHPIIAENDFLWKTGGSDSIYIDFDSNRLLISKKELILKKKIFPYFQAGATYFFSDMYILYNRINHSYIYVENATKIRLNTTAGITAYIFYIDTKISFDISSGKSVNHIPELNQMNITLTTSVGIDLGGFQIGYRYSKNNVSYNAFVPQLNSHSIYIEIDYTRIHIKSLQ